MKRILSIILAILMIVTSVPFAFAADEGFRITHQPTVDEFYVETNDPNAEYQWYEEMNGYEIDDTWASPYTPSSGSELDSSYYTEESGWYPSYRKNFEGVRNGDLGFFDFELHEDEIVTFEFSSDEIDSVYLQGLSSYNLNRIDITIDGNIATYRHSGSTVRYRLFAEAENIVTVKARSHRFSRKLRTLVSGFLYAEHRWHILSAARACRTEE